MRKNVAKCRLLLGAWSPDELTNQRQGRLLISPFGLSPGLLFTAIHHTRPTRLVVVSSAAALTSLPEALARAGFPNNEATVLKVEFKDVWADFGEVEPALSAGLVKSLLDISEVVVNVTGGTSLLGYAAQRLAEKLARFALPVRRVALIDRRPPEVQRAEPYEVGDIAELGCWG